MDKSFERNYSVEIPKLKDGLNELIFDIDKGFFDNFDYSPVKDGKVHIQAAITKYSSHLDAVFQLDGHIILECDRCLEPYPHPVHTTRRVVFSFGKPTREMEELDDVVVIPREEFLLPLANEFYDFLNLEAPLRKVPPPSVHLCSPEVLRILGIGPEGGEQEHSGEEEE